MASQRAGARVGHPSPSEGPQGCLGTEIDPSCSDNCCVVFHLGWSWEQG